MRQELYENISEEELEKFSEVDAHIDKDSFKVASGVCPMCNLKMEKIIENRNLFDGALTFHVIKFRCNKCNKEYLDLEQAQKYDLFLLLEKFSKKSTHNMKSMIENLRVLIKA